jgi:glycosyltransferase involved in cell wall biosynthesis
VQTKSLAIVIPSYNEGQYLNGLLLELESTVIELRESGWDTEVIFIDDGSTDDTRKIVSNFKIMYFYQPNQGKGAAVRTGVLKAESSFIVVLDADGEYAPREILNLVKKIRGGEEIVIYGTRYKTDRLNQSYIFIPFDNQSFLNLYFNYFLSILNFLRTGVWISDLLTGYKIYPKRIYDELPLKTKGFETDHEITRLLITKNIKIIEIPISYTPRNRSQGKKIGIFDAIKAVWIILR